MNWKQTPEKAASQRNGSPSREGSGLLTRKAGPALEKEARMLERGTPPGVCGFAWRGDMCWRVSCTFSHLLASATAKSVAVPEQQLQALPPLSSPATLLHQPPLYQAAAAAGERGGMRRGESVTAAERRTV